MGDRIFVVIFFFWAALTIITPTLVLLSESSKPFLDTNGQVSEGIKDRRMIGYGVKRSCNSSTSSIQMKAASSTIDHKWSWLQQLEGLVSRVFQKAMGLLISTS
ncbi:Endoplasmatic reticulum retrieval protein 1B isoform 1 [Hibiscus syriacus]|uniref:Endoplasmatic reticulum retrieval protein 1B isoform 1 n=1 Tax=Hibiscus syriacus TaxID=106335 RepID=A0A6A3B8B6_HIBSY|nr:Endoplasmatic reticulum retrieval protein 1B isoform 1 [Hibiscus syriacus]